MARQEGTMMHTPNCIAAAFSIRRGDIHAKSLDLKAPNSQGVASIPSSKQDNLSTNHYHCWRANANDGSDSPKHTKKKYGSSAPATGLQGFRKSIIDTYGRYGRWEKQRARRRGAAEQPEQRAPSTQQRDGAAHTHTDSIKESRGIRAACATHAARERHPRPHAITEQCALFTSARDRQYRRSSPLVVCIHSPRAKTPPASRALHRPQKPPAPRRARPTLITRTTRVHRVHDARHHQFGVHIPCVALERPVARRFSPRGDASVVSSSPLAHRRGSTAHAHAHTRRAASASAARAEHPPPLHPPPPAIAVVRTTRVSRLRAHLQRRRLRNAVTAAAQQPPPPPPGTRATTARTLPACASLTRRPHAPRFASVRARSAWAPHRALHHVRIRAHPHAAHHTAQHPRAPRSSSPSAAPPPRMKTRAPKSKGSAEGAPLFKPSTFSAPAPFSTPARSASASAPARASHGDMTAPKQEEAPKRRQRECTLWRSLAFAGIHGGEGRREEEQGGKTQGAEEDEDEAEGSAEGGEEREQGLGRERGGRERWRERRRDEVREGDRETRRAWQHGVREEGREAGSGDEEGVDAGRRDEDAGRKDGDGGEERWRRGNTGAGGGGMGRTEGAGKKREGGRGEAEKKGRQGRHGTAEEADGRAGSEGRTMSWAGKAQGRKRRDDGDAKVAEGGEGRRRRMTGKGEMKGGGRWD
ncbi:hypothetical protein DFH09DRAFT_1400744 [Mycena vulgaris]|nr:hypothetical protein DFH09DRAFT_1400744 [Mycena vulgaris]